MKQKIIIGLILALFAGTLHPALFADSDEHIVIIGHMSVADSLRKKDIKQIFLGEKTVWDNNEKIKFAVFSDKKAHMEFLKKYVGKTSAQYRNYWKMKVFSGLGRMPESFGNKADLISYVSSTEGSISFVSSKELDESKVKIIQISR